MCVIALVFQASAQAEPVCSEKQATEQKYLSALILKKNYQSAIKHLRQQYSKQADHRILAQIKDIYLLDKNLSGWSEYLTKALSDNSRDPRIIFELAAIDIADKKYDLAFEKANHIFATTQSPEYAFEIYISAYSEIGEYKKVLELYDRYIQLSTKDDLSSPGSS